MCSDEFGRDLLEVVIVGEPLRHWERYPFVIEPRQTVRKVFRLKNMNAIFAGALLVCRFLNSFLSRSSSPEFE